MIADHEERLRRLALHDDDLIGPALAIHLDRVEASGPDPKTCALVRLGALVALGAPCVCYQWALAAGATADELVGGPGRGGPHHRTRPRGRGRARAGDRLRPRCGV